MNGFRSIERGEPKFIFEWDSNGAHDANVCVWERLYGKDSCGRTTPRGDRGYPNRCIDFGRTSGAAWTADGVRIIHGFDCEIVVRTGTGREWTDSHSCKSGEEGPFTIKIEL